MKYLFISLISQLYLASLFAQNTQPHQKSVSSENSISLEKFIELVKLHSDEYKAIERSIEAAEFEIKSRDLELSSTLTAELAEINDSQPTTSNLIRRSDSRFLDLNLNKLFSTGTTLGLSAGQELNQSSITGENNITDWEIKLTQSLWRNSFGKLTNLRRQSDGAEYKSRRFASEFQKHSLLIEIETLYWDLVTLLKEEEIRKGNLERSLKLEKWTRDRARRSAAEPTDLLQVQALASGRRLDLLSTQNRIKLITEKVGQYIPNLDIKNLNPDPKSLVTDRDYKKLIIGTTAESPARLDVLAQKYLAEKNLFEADRIKNSLSPSLDAYVGYGKNGIDNDYSSSSRRAFNSDQEMSSIGLVFSMELDGDLKDDRRRSAMLLAQSQSFFAKSLERNAQLEWSDFERNVQSLRGQSFEAKQLAEFQTKKSIEEQKRYQLGRSTVFQLVSFEQDAAEAELRYYLLLSNLRKTEARARVYTSEAM